MSDRTRAAELSLAEGLTDLPIADLSETGLDVRGYEARMLKTPESRPILRYPLEVLPRCSWTSSSPSIYGFDDLLAQVL